MRTFKEIFQESKDSVLEYIRWNITQIIIFSLLTAFAVFIADLSLANEQYIGIAKVLVKNFTPSNTSTGITSNGKTVVTHNSEKYSLIVSFKRDTLSVKTSISPYLKVREGDRIKIFQVTGRIAGIQYEKIAK